MGTACWLLLLRAGWSSCLSADLGLKDKFSCGDSQQSEHEVPPSPYFIIYYHPISQLLTNFLQIYLILADLIFVANVVLVSKIPIERIIYSFIKHFGSRF